MAVCNFCNVEIVQGDRVLDMVRFQTIVGTLSGKWLSEPSNKTFLFKTPKSPEPKFVHQACLVTRLDGLSFEDTASPAEKCKTCGPTGWRPSNQ